MIAFALVTAFAITTLKSPSTAVAWEPTTTHAGLTEQSVAASRLHKHLVHDLALPAGILETLAIPRADAPELFAILDRLNPTHGYAPDTRGRLTAIGWLAAGAVIADLPPTQAANHFFDVVSKKGLSAHSVAGLARRVREAVFSMWFGTTHPTSGRPATEWIRAEDNPMNVAAFYSQYERAIRASTPAERSRHLAAALLVAGSLLHVLHDMASPSHVRDDLAAHLDTVGADPRDRGSRHERVAALAWGRVGVPPAHDVPVAARLDELFVGGEGVIGLATWTSTTWLSAHTMPRDVELGSAGGRAAQKARVAASGRRALPAPPALLDMLGARGEDGARFETNEGVCIGKYRITNDQLQWFADDACSLEQLAVQLERASAYGAALVNWLIRGTVIVSANGISLNVASGPGELAVYAEDKRGVRTAVGRFAAVAGGKASTQLGSLAAIPSGTTRLAILYRGTDGNDEPMVAATTVPWPLPSK